ncbi:D-alanyl-D-alanine carboxypeptidase family protein [Ruminococcus sp. Marseille-P6503]|uniref:D-alanyl-D-alanine carboxypeptidase family protein n=1 Tax=Ruminococcus sp. Marseille-P6503 TaxID=2364796 RepID=UPI000F52E3A6|nr:D-alanyl-D-alanine carboxypeptidase family protein [Ruminococcus sp. Marseille-P6503]
MIFKHIISVSAAIILLVTAGTQALLPVTSAAYRNVANSAASFSAWQLTGNPLTSVTPDAPDSPSLISLSSTDKSVTVNWTKVKGATGYRVYRYDFKTGSFISRTSIKNNNISSWTDEKVSSGTAYKYKVKSYVKIDGVNYWSGYSNTLCTAVKPQKIAITKANRTYDAVRLFWEPVTCNGYQIYMYSPDTKKWQYAATVKDPSADQYRVSGLKRGTKYKFRIRAYKCDADRKNYFGSFGNSFSVTTKPEIIKKNGITYVEGILIANKTYALPSNYNPDMDSSALNAFYKMQRAARNDGINLWICSGFRSYSYQQYLYSSYAARDGKAAADRYSARAGHSEHQTGLAMDVNNASSSFEGTKEAKWLAANCSDYGFIIRYPKNKESVTGYKYEPWHIRYLGVKTATAVEKSGKCLEEYLGITSKYK